MGFDKLSATLCGLPVLLHTVNVFASLPDISEVVVVGHPSRLDSFRSMLASVDKLAGVVGGGSERCLSVWQGLQFVRERECELVAVHDGARPLVSQADIVSCLEAAEIYGAAACARRVTETLKREAADGFIGEPVERDGLWAMETPQAFQCEPLCKAYEKLLAAGRLATDETSVMQFTGTPVKIVESTSLNVKITYPSDLALAEAWLDARN